MLLAISGVILVFVLVLVLFYSKVRISIQYTYVENNQHVTISIFIFMIRFFKKKYDLRAFVTDKNLLEEIKFDSFSAKIKALHQTWKEATQLLTDMLKKVHLHHFSWITTGGTGDAFTTGLASGGIWSIKGIITGYLLEKVRLDCHPYIYVEPQFQQKFLRTDVDCMFSIRFGQAIQALIKLNRK
ncbi:DUF2953 domain-containing protein [Oceanobacillus saliphilus]|uniref:DUF2953 domain-containing protein n=1 Tax=Oceanobacillus saliphilus TaxID=2925834 RepID=UPI00201E5548|nr:DUF2953 domain-containing protein [Oceanobacillus saliphilus]